MAHRSYRIPIKVEPDIHRAVLQTIHLCQRIGFRESDCSRMATVVSELVRNVLKYADEGELWLHQITSEQLQGVELQVIDRGPGIDDVELALQDHYSTGKTLGLGLPGVKRMVDEFALETASTGTCITVRKWQEGPKDP